MAESDAKRIDVDNQWKAQAEAEKARLEGKETASQPAPSQATGGAAAPGGGGTGQADQGSAAGGRPRMPPASFSLLVEEYATQVMFALGAIPHPATGKAMKDLAVAKHYIDMLAVLEEKTKGNLTGGEERLLASTLYEMRMAYVNAVQRR